MDWDPATYERFGDHRYRPFEDLLQRVAAPDPRTVIDLGCGNGRATLALSARWPNAQVVGVDSSASMLHRAREVDTESRVEWVQADLATYQLPPACDVVVTNATLQWVPGHDRLIRLWVDALPAGGWFAMQVPGNFDAPSHRLLREVAACSPRARELAAVLRGAGAVREPGEYAELLAGAACDIDVWETTYQQVLDPAGKQAAPVLEWTRGTALRPVLGVLTDPGERDRFLAAYAEALARAYPRGACGTLFPFRRIFAVAHRPVGCAGTAAGARVLALDHVQVSCPAGSEPVLREFYAGVLGMREVAKPAALAARGGVWFESGRARLHCGVEEDFRPAAKAHPALAVADLDQVAEALAACGAPVTWDGSIPGVRRIHTHDPVGNRVEMQQI